MYHARLHFLLGVTIHGRAWAALGHRHCDGYLVLGLAFDVSAVDIIYMGLVCSVWASTSRWLTLRAVWALTRAGHNIYSLSVPTTVFENFVFENFVFYNFSKLIRITLFVFGLHFEIAPHHLIDFMFENLCSSTCSRCWRCTLTSSSTSFPKPKLRN